jgi:large subunit ribosomal protein L25
MSGRGSGRFAPYLTMKLTATQRDLTGPRASRLRRDGRLPGIVYGHHAAPVPVSLDSLEFQKVFARTGRSNLIDLELDGGRPHKVLVKEVQIHPRRPGPIHVDLFEVSLKEKLHLDVPIVLIGESPAVKRNDGDLLQTAQTIAVECLPSDIPQNFQVDISGLEEVDAGIRVGDLTVPPGVTLLVDADELIVKVAARRVMAVEEEEAAAVEEAAEGAPEAESAQEPAAAEDSSQ